jgi:peptide/nickel transport system permease protein
MSQDLPLRPFEISGQDEVPEAAPSRPGFIRTVILGNRGALVGSVVLALFVIIAVLAPVLSPHSATDQIGPVYAAPNGTWLLGLDDGGVDILSQLITGARVSLEVGLAATAVAMGIGVSVGVVSGYFGGKSDTILMRITDYFLVIPDVPLMIVFAALFGRRLENIIIIIGIIYWTATARVIRAQVKSVRERVYVQRARSLGASHTRLITHHVLPQVTPLIVANVVLTIATAVFAETYIAFLGLSDPTLPSWGRMIQNSLTGGAIFHNAWWAVVPPGLAVTVVILACTMIGQALEDALNPRLRSGHLSTRRFRVRPFSARLDRV